MKLNPKIKKIYSLSIKIAIIIISFGFIYRQLFFKKNTTELFLFFKQFSFSNEAKALLILVFLLMFVNWGLESLKWKYLLSKIENISFIKAFKAIFCSATFNTFMPNRTGDFAGRIFFLKKANYWEGVFITAIGSFSQLLITVSAGLLSGLYFVSNFTLLQIYFSAYSLGITYISVIAVNILLFFLFFNISFLTMLLRRIPFFKATKLKIYTRIFSIYSAKNLLNVLLLSLFRYIVFIFQFFVLLKIFNVQISFVDAFPILSLNFLIVTIIPTFALSELGVRGSVAFILFDYYFNAHQIMYGQLAFAVIAATTTLWLINLIIPAIAGSLFIFNLNFFRKKV